MIKLNCDIELDCGKTKEVEEFINEKAAIFEERRRVRLFNKFQKSRESCRKQAEENMKINAKLPFNCDDQSNGLNNKSKINVKIVSKAKTIEEKPRKTYMHLENSYIRIPKNIIKSEGKHDEVIVNLIKEGRKKFSGNDGNQQLMNAIKEKYDVSEEYIRNVLKSSIKNSSNKLVDVPDACSAKCYKKYKGEKCYYYDMTVADETQIKLKLLSSKDFCSIAKDLNKNCNDVYSISMNTTLGSGETAILKSKKMKMILSTNFIQYKKISELYEGFPKFYRPCTHEGADCDDTCPCFQGKNFCEIFCCCSKDCKNRFFGCVCKAKCETKQCPCYAASRECITGQCSCKAGCDEDCCNNMKIQLNQRKKIDIAPSSVAGFGGFAGEDIKKGEFVVEYTGELITHEETEKRGMLYNNNKVSYIFDLTSDYAIDAMYIGNESRFLNHSDNPNCSVKFITVFGDKRIGFFANRFIRAGEEMFIDYCYNEEEKNFYFGNI